MKDLIDRLDVLYVHFVEVVGGEPGGGGLLPVAFVKTCGGGCGLRGFKGIELDPATVDETSAYGVDGAYRYAIHELTHNFDLYGDYIAYGSDVGHVWTDFVNPYVPFYDRTGGGIGDPAPKDGLQNAVDVFFWRYVGFPGRSWARCVRDDACDPAGDMGQHAQGGVALRIAQASRPATVKLAMRHLRDAIAARSLRPDAMSILEKNDLLIESLSHGAGLNLACFFDGIDWPVSPELRADLERAFASDPKCRDDDGDGWTRFLGDCDDTRATVRPGATEAPNGVDDDCNGLVDDATIFEARDFPDSRASALPVRMPVHLQGEVSASDDVDVFAMDLSSRTAVTFSLDSPEDFAGFLFLYPRDGGEGWRAYSYVGPSGRATLHDVLDAGAWEFAVAFNNASHTGPYELSVARSRPQVERRAPPAGRVDPSGRLVLVAPKVPGSVPNRGAVQVRFWVSGAGFVGTVAAARAATTTFTWTPPPGLAPAAVGYRVQFLQKGLPATAISPFARVKPGA